MDIFPTAFLYGVWGSSGGNVFAVGAGGTIIHYDGAKWSTMASTITKALSGVAGTGKGAAFAVSSSMKNGQGVVLELAAGSWSPLTMVSSKLTYSTLNSIWGVNGPGDLFVVGNGAVALRRSSGTWNKMNTGTTKDLLSVWAGSPTNVLVGDGGGQVLSFDGAKWTGKTLWTTNYPVRAVWGATNGTSFAGGDRSWIYQYAWGNWTQMTVPTSTGCSGNAYLRFSSLWGTSALNVYGAGRCDGSGEHPFIARYNGLSWSTLKTFGQSVHRHGWVRGIWGANPSSTYFVGGSNEPKVCSQCETPLFYHYNGSAWLDLKPPTKALMSVAGDPKNSPVAVGVAGAVLRYDGKKLISMQSGTDGTLNGIWISKTGEMYAVGEHGTILRRCAKTP